MHPFRESFHPKSMSEVKKEESDKKQFLSRDRIYLSKNVPESVTKDFLVLMEKYPVHKKFKVRGFLDFVHTSFENITLSVSLEEFQACFNIPDEMLTPLIQGDFLVHIPWVKVKKNGKEYLKMRIKVRKYKQGGGGYEPIVSTLEEFWNKETESWKLDGRVEVKFKLGTYDGFPEAGTCGIYLRTDSVIPVAE